MKLSIKLRKYFEINNDIHYYATCIMFLLMVLLSGCKNNKDTSGASHSRASNSQNIGPNNFKKATLTEIKLTSDKESLKDLKEEFTLTFENTTVSPLNLSDYILTMTLTEKGATGSFIEYSDKDDTKIQTNSIKHPLNHFNINNQEILPASASITIPFTAEVSKGVADMVISIELENKEEKTAPLSIQWHITGITDEMLEAARKNNLPILEQVLKIIKEKGKKITDINGSDLNLPEYAKNDDPNKVANGSLHEATEINRLDIVKILHDAGGDLRYKYRKELLTVMHMAAYHNAMEIGKFLLETEAKEDIKTKDVRLITPIIFCLERNNVQFLEMLKKVDDTVNLNELFNNRTFPLTPLTLAIANNNKAMVIYLVEQGGADVNLATKAGLTPLHFAAAYNRADIAGYLLDNKANINAKSPNGYTALHWAAWSNSQPTYRLLLDRGAKRKYVGLFLSPAKLWKIREKELKKEKKIMDETNATSEKELRKLHEQRQKQMMQENPENRQEEAKGMDE